MIPQRGGNGPSLSHVMPGVSGSGHAHRAQLRTAVVCRLGRRWAGATEAAAEVVAVSGAYLGVARPAPSDLLGTRAAAASLARLAWPCLVATTCVGQSSRTGAAVGVGCGGIAPIGFYEREDRCAQRRNGNCGVAPMRPVAVAGGAIRPMLPKAKHQRITYFHGVHPPPAPSQVSPINRSRGWFLSH